MVQNVGKMIYKLREETGIAQKNLVRGLISVAELSRLENGELTSDSFLIEALLQRMGKSADKIEIMVTKEEYELIALRRLIFESLKTKDCEMTTLLMEEYREYPESKKPLHRQYLCQMEALNEYLALQESERCILKLEQAFHITFSQSDEMNWETEYMCLQEIQILLLRNYFLLLSERTGEATQSLEQLWNYLNQRCTDEEERAKIIPQCAWLLGQTYRKEAKIVKAEETFSIGIACLCKNGVVTLLGGLLEEKIACAEILEQVEMVAECKKQQKALEFLYEIAECEMPENDFTALLMTSLQREYLVSSECLRELRLSQGMSQMELSEGICSWETLSRMETGVRKPNRKNLHKLFQKLQYDRGTYYGYVAADDYSLYEKIYESRRMGAKGEHEGALNIMRKVAEKLDMSVAQNRQYVEMFFLLDQFRKKELEDVQILEELEKLLRYTMQEYDGRLHRTPFRGESDILNTIALCLRRLGKMEEAAALYEQILEKYQAGKMTEMYHTIPTMPIYINYVAILMKMGKLEKAKKVAKRGIQINLRCQRCDMTSKLLANCGDIFSMEKTAQADKVCEDAMRSSVILLKLYGYAKSSTVVEQYFEERYHRKLVI